MCALYIFLLMNLQSFAILEFVLWLYNDSGIGGNDNGKQAGLVVRGDIGDDENNSKMFVGLEA